MKSAPRPTYGTDDNRTLSKYIFILIRGLYHNLLQREDSLDSDSVCISGGGRVLIDSEADGGAQVLVYAISGGNLDLEGVVDSGLDPQVLVNSVLHKESGAGETSLGEAVMSGNEQISVTLSQAEDSLELSRAGVEVLSESSSEGGLAHDDLVRDSQLEVLE